jgi:hypothetical protein
MRTLLCSLLIKVGGDYEKTLEKKNRSGGTEMVYGLSGVASRLGGRDDVVPTPGGCERDCWWRAAYDAPPRTASDRGSSGGFLPFWR